MKKKTKDKIALASFSIAGTLFLVALFTMVWDHIRTNAKMVLIVTGSIMVILTLLGYFNKKKFIRGLKKRF